MSKYKDPKSLGCTILVDDVGSFPLPINVNRQAFDQAYNLTRKAIIDGKEIAQSVFSRVVIDSFKRKLRAGLDVATYPQHYDMCKQFTEPIHKVMDDGTYVIDRREAVIPEVYLINQEAKNLCEEFGKKISLRVCVTGPMELYLREIGTVFYEDILLMLAETIKRFAENSILNTKWVKTEVVSIDEPSFGLQDTVADRDVVLEALDTAFDFDCAVKQIHLHSASRIADVLDSKNVDVVSFESASSPNSIERVSRRMLDGADKSIRVGISRTDVDYIEDEEVIRKRFAAARERFGDRMSFVGPDCGLGGWLTPEAAQILLERTVSAVKIPASIIVEAGSPYPLG